MEDLIPHTVMLTRPQIRKLESMGDGALRNLISTARAGKLGRSSIEYLKNLSSRDKAIVKSPYPADEVAEKYMLSPQRVRQIRKAYRELSE